MSNTLPISEELTPKAIVSALDLYIIGQKKAKRNVAIALRNRWRWMNTAPDMRKEIVPSNILMIGATGVGKTEVARRLAKLVQAPFVKVEASKFTEVGYVGRDVESMIRDLVNQSVNMVKQEKRGQLREKAVEQVEDIILQAIIRPKTSEQVSSDSLNEGAKEGLRERIRRGDMDNQKIDIEVSVRPKGMDIGFVGSPNMDDSSLSSMQDMLSSFLPKKKKTRKVSIGEAKKILMEEVLSGMVDMDEVKEEALNRAQQLGIVFIDEVDKIVSRGAQQTGAEVSREGVQRDLLPIVEGSAVQTKYGVVHTDNILFIAAGAFHHAKPSDLIPELQGRFAIRVELQSLSEKDFFRILKEPKNALSKQYKALFGAENVKLVLSDKALEIVAKISFQLNQEVEDIGARRLSMVMNHLFNQELFDMPDQIPPNSIVEVSQEEVEQRLQSLTQNKDLNQYIL